MYTELHSLHAKVTMNKVFGVIMTGVSTILFIALGSGAMRDPLFGLIPALALGISGLKLLLRDNRYRAPEPLPTEIADRLQRIERSISSLVVDLDATQRSVQHLTEERAFLEKLLVERKNEPQQLLVDHV